MYTHSALYLVDESTCNKLEAAITVMANVFRNIKVSHSKVDVTAQKTWLYPIMDEPGDCYSVVITISSEAQIGSNVTTYCHEYCQPSLIIEDKLNDLSVSWQSHIYAAIFDGSITDEFIQTASRLTREWRRIGPVNITLFQYDYLHFALTIHSDCDTTPLIKMFNDQLKEFKNIFLGYAQI